MGFLKNLFFGKEKEKTGIEKQAEDLIKEHPKEYAHAQVENIPTCNGCGQDIEGKPRIKEHGGKMMYFHKRCWKAMQRGEFPKPIIKEEQTQENGQYDKRGS